MSAAGGCCQVQITPQTLRKTHNTEMTAGWPTEPLTQRGLCLNALTTQLRPVCVDHMRGDMRCVAGRRCQDRQAFSVSRTVSHLDLCRSTAAGSDADLAGSLWLAFDLLRGASERDFLRLGLVDCTLLESESERKSSATGGRKQRSMAAGCVKVCAASRLRRCERVFL